MGDDPRERIETEHIRCDDITPTQWIIAAVGQHAPAFADWPEVVAFAHAVLAADAEYREQNAPTLAELRERYPDKFPGIVPKNCANDCVTAYLRDGTGIEHECASEVDALEWLAKELAK